MVSPYHSLAPTIYAVSARTLHLDNVNSEDCGRFPLSYHSPSFRTSILPSSLHTYNTFPLTKMSQYNTYLQISQASTNYKEAFALFDKRGNGRVALESLGDLLRACGQNPTLAEIRDLEKGVGGDCEPP